MKTQQLSTPLLPALVMAASRTLLSSCGESYRSVHPGEINRTLTVQRDIADPEEIIQLYVDWPVETRTVEVETTVGKTLLRSP